MEDRFAKIHYESSIDHEMNYFNIDLRIKWVDKELLESIQNLDGVANAFNNNAYRIHVHKGKIFEWEEIIPNVKYLIEEYLKEVKS